MVFAIVAVLLGIQDVIVQAGDEFIRHVLCQLLIRQWEYTFGMVFSLDGNLSAGPEVGRQVGPELVPELSDGLCQIFFIYSYGSNWRI